MKNSSKNTIIRLMTEANLPQLYIDVFLSQYATMVANETSTLREASIQPIASIAALAADPDFSSTGIAALEQTVVIKLNGGLGTGMGLEQTKSLLLAKEGLSFLEIIARQIISQRNKFNSSLPLLLMNSFNTEADTQAMVANLAELQHGQKGIPLTFTQHKAPKIFNASQEPAQWAKDPTKVWCPPGHGDIYTVLQTSGLLEQLLKQGIQYAFIANADNLGASLDLSMLGYFVAQETPFMMEVAERTTADSKGGHLARAANGKLLLRESAQVHADDSKSFQDCNKHRYFNTNNLWLRLDRLKQRLAASQGMLDLPLLQNRKTIDPSDPSSPAVIQLETAIGAAISCFDDAIAVRVPRARFIPVKTTNELLGLRSNAFVLDKNSRLLINPERQAGVPLIKLDPRYFASLDKLQARFPDGSPDLLECQQFTVTGDVLFGAGVKIIGKVRVNNPTDKQRVIASGTVLSGE